MSKRNKDREIWLDRYRTALVQACGAAAVLGFTDHAATICEMIDAARVDSRVEKCYNTNNQRQKARKTEGYTMTINIRLTQDAYVCGGNGCEYRLHTDTGAPSIYVLYDWYEAAAVDADGNEYLVVWSLRRGYNPEIQDESDACDWDSPAEIIRLDTGDNVTSYAKIEW